MANNRNSYNARLEVEKRRKAYHQRTQTNKKSSTRSWKPLNTPNLPSAWMIRKTLPFAYLIYCFTAAFLVSLIICAFSFKVDSRLIDPLNNELIKIEIPKANNIYSFSIEQQFSTNTAPLYSELEIELLDENFDHVYSFYKDLWQEFHDNGEGRLVLYKDLKIDFKVALDRAGSYYIRPISYNNNDAFIHFSLARKPFGNMYLVYFTYLFGGLSLLLLLGSSKWGSPYMMKAEAKKIRGLRQNKLFILATGLSIALFIGAWYVALTNHGYPSGGDETVLPTMYYKTNGVNYLG